MKNLELDYEAVKKFQFYIQKMNAALDIDGVTPFITEKSYIEIIILKTNGMNP